MPIPAPTKIVNTKAKISGNPYSSIFTKRKELIGIIEPTERSNSPLIISIPTPIAMIPRSGVSFPSAPRLSERIKT